MPHCKKSKLSKSEDIFDQEENLEKKIERKY